MRAVAADRHRGGAPTRIDIINDDHGFEIALELGGMTLVVEPDCLRRWALLGVKRVRAADKGDMGLLPEARPRRLL